MRLIACLIVMLTGCFCFAQNNARLFNTSGKVFRVLVNDKPISKNWQAEVLLEKVKKDTLLLKIEFENGEKHDATLYLMEKGKTCTSKEFNYRVVAGDHTCKLIFTGMYDIQNLPDPLVPKLPAAAKPVAPVAPKKEPAPQKTTANCVAPAPDEKISELLAKLKLQGDDGLRFELLKKVHADHCYSVGQVKLLLACFSHDRDKLRGAKLLYPYSVEKEKYESVSETFVYDNIVSEFKSFLESQKK